jgi:hypothetical protein
LAEQHVGPGADGDAVAFGGAEGGLACVPVHHVVPAAGVEPDGLGAAPGRAGSRGEHGAADGASELADLDGGREGLRRTCLRLTLPS